MHIFLYMCFHWIYFANNCGVLFSWGDVCVPFGHMVGSCTCTCIEFLPIFLDMHLYWIYFTRTLAPPRTLAPLGKQLPKKGS